MRVTHYYLTAMPVSIALMLTLACDNSNPSTTEPIAIGMGAIEITVATTGAQLDIDPDGYTLSIDAGTSELIDVNATVRIGGLVSGRHRVQLEGVAANCSVDGTTGRSVDVVGDAGVSRVSFSVSCVESFCPGCWDY